MVERSRFEWGRILKERRDRQDSKRPNLKFQDIKKSILPDGFKHSPHSQVRRGFFIDASKKSYGLHVLPEELKLTAGQLADFFSGTLKKQLEETHGVEIRLVSKPVTFISVSKSVGRNTPKEKLQTPVHDAFNSLIALLKQS